MQHDEIGALVVFAPVRQLGIQLANVIDACYRVASRRYVAIHDGSRKYARLVGTAFHHNALAIDRHIAPRCVFRAICKTMNLLFARKDLLDIIGPRLALGRVNMLNPNRADIVHHVARQAEIDHCVMRPARPIACHVAHKEIVALGRKRHSLKKTTLNTLRIIEHGRSHRSVGWPLGLDILAVQDIFLGHHRFLQRHTVPSYNPRIIERCCRSRASCPRAAQSTHRQKFSDNCVYYHTFKRFAITRFASSSMASSSGASSSASPRRS